MSEERPGEHSGQRPKIKITDRRISTRDGSAPAPPGADPTSDPDDAPTASREAKTRGEVGGGDEVERARAEAAEYLDHLRRLQAEFDNYRKRVLKEQTRAIQLAGEPLVRRLLDVLDDFDLAMLAADEKPDFERFHRGVELVYAKLIDGLNAEGLERIDATGKPFDPEEHEALLQTGDGDGEPVVAEVLRQGYKLNGHVLRPAGVRVSRG
jgi:molecular chaperone GrpE